MKLDRVPSLLEFYSYCFSCGNLLAGPFFEAKEYFDFVDRKVTGTAFYLREGV